MMTSMTDGMELIIGAGIIIMFGVIVFGLLATVLYVVGNYRLAKNEGMEDIAWFVLIPVLGSYVFGKIPERTAPRSLRKYLGLANAILFGLAFTTQIMWVLYLPLFAYTVFLTYKRYSNKYVVMMIVTVLTGFVAYPFMVFAIRNNKVVTRDDRDEYSDAFELYQDEGNESASKYTDN